MNMKKIVCGVAPSPCHHLLVCVCLCLCACVCASSVGSVRTLEKASVGLNIKAQELESSFFQAAVCTFTCILCVYRWVCLCVFCACVCLHKCTSRCMCVHAWCACETDRLFRLVYNRCSCVHTDLCNVVNTGQSLVS